MTAVGPFVLTPVAQGVAVIHQLKLPVWGRTKTFALTARSENFETVILKVGLLPERREIVRHNGIEAEIAVVPVEKVELVLD